MSRYSQAIGKLAFDLEVGMQGIGYAVVPPGEHAAVAEALRERFPSFATAPADIDRIFASGRLVLVEGLPGDRKQAIEALVAINSRRNTIGDHLMLVLLLSMREFLLFQKYASDSWSAVRFGHVIDFVADETVDDSKARQALARWQRDKFGRLDLRGFVRSEAEDVSWAVDSIYQELMGRPLSNPEGQPPVWVSDGFPAVPLVNILSAGRLSVPATTQIIPVLVLLGQPGAGKTFFLRHCALRFAEDPEFGGVSNAVPVLLSLAAFARSAEKDLLGHCRNWLLDNAHPAGQVFDRAVHEGRAVFLLDGLDEGGSVAARRRTKDAIGDLQRRAPRCLVVVTSRIAGYEEVRIPALEATIARFEEEATRGFLIRWCELYAVDRRGDSTVSRSEGRSEGKRLAEDVLQSEQLKDLASVPLLLTVLAIIHRTGIRLPDHRIELYAHMAQILVERWSRLRSLAGDSGASPIRATDAARILGPVALEMVRFDNRVAITEDRLRSLLDRAIADGRLRSVTTAQEAIHLFKGEVALLVEHAPGRYSFLHLTLLEYFAAHDLVRTGEIEALCAVPAAFAATYLEVILLALGELGIIRADDHRLSAIIARLVERSRSIDVNLGMGVPMLLSRILAEDPFLSASDASLLGETLVPHLWFDADYTDRDFDLVLVDAREVLGRIMNGRYSAHIGSRIAAAYEPGLPARLRDRLLHNMTMAPSFFDLLIEAGADYGNAFVELAGGFPIVFLPRPELLRSAGRVDFEVPVSTKAASAPGARLRVWLHRRDEDKGIAEWPLLDVANGTAALPVVRVEGWKTVFRVEIALDDEMAGALEQVGVELRAGSDDLDVMSDHALTSPNLA